MPLFLVILKVVYSVFIILLIGARRTVSLRALSVFLMLGALLGSFAYPLVSRLVSPYGWAGANQTLAAVAPGFLTVAGAGIIFLMPILALLDTRRVFAGLSVADAFLMSFALGFGFELAGVLRAAVTATEAIKGITLLPPFLLETSSISVPGATYWLALPTLAYAAVRRFHGSSFHARIAFAIFLVYGSLESISPALPADSWMSFFPVITLHGALTAWVVLAAVVVLSLVESRWADQHGGQSASRLSSELQELVTKTVTARWKEAVRSDRTYCLQRREQLLKAEAQIRGDGALLAKSLESVRAALAGTSDGANQAAPVRSRQTYVQWAVLILAFGVFFNPVLPDSAREAFWSAPLLHYKLSADTPSLLCLFLAGLVFWRFLMFPSRPFAVSDIDDVVSFSGERGILYVSLALAILTIAYGHVEQVFQISNLAERILGLRMPDSDASRVPLLAMSLAAALSGMALSRSRRWQAMPGSENKRSSVRNFLRVEVLLLGTWCSVFLFQTGQALLHQRFGPWLYSGFGSNGNSAGDALLGVMGLLVSFGMFRGLFGLARRAERFVFEGQMVRKAPAPGGATRRAVQASS